MRRIGVVALVAVAAAVVAVAYLATRAEPSFWPVFAGVCAIVLLLMTCTAVGEELTIERSGLRSKQRGLLHWHDITEYAIDDLRSPPAIDLKSRAGRWTFVSLSIFDTSETQQYESFLIALQCRLKELPEGSDAGECGRASSGGVRRKLASESKLIRVMAIVLVPVLGIGLFVAPGKALVFLPVLIPVIAIVLMRSNGNKGK